MAVQYYSIARAITITTGSNDVIKFEEAGGGAGQTATIASGEYFLHGASTTYDSKGAKSILDAIVTALNASGSGTYSVTLPTTTFVSGVTTAVTGPFADQDAGSSNFFDPLGALSFFWQIACSGDTFNFETSGTTFDDTQIGLTFAGGNEAAKEGNGHALSVWTPTQAPSSDTGPIPAYDISQMQTKGGALVTFNRGGPYYARRMGWDLNIDAAIFDSGINASTTGNLHRWVDSAIGEHVVISPGEMVSGATDGAIDVYSNTWLMGMHPRGGASSGYAHLGVLLPESINTINQARHSNGLDLWSTSLAFGSTTS